MDLLAGCLVLTNTAISEGRCLALPAAMRDKPSTKMNGMSVILGLLAFGVLMQMIGHGLIDARHGNLWIEHRHRRSLVRHDRLRACRHILPQLLASIMCRRIGRADITGRDKLRILDHSLEGNCNQPSHVGDR